MVAERIKGAFQQTPVTAWFITANLVVWLLDFFGVRQPMAILGGTLDVAHAWRWLTYSIATPSWVLWLLFGLWCFSGFAAFLERSWGSEYFARVFLILILLSSVVSWMATALSLQSVQVTATISGFWYPMSALIMIWASINREATILLMGLLPIVAKWVALAVVVLAFFSPAGPLYGLPFALFFIACWKWAERLGGAGVPRGGRQSFGRLRQWWSQRKRAKRLGRFQLLEGGGQLGTPSSPSSPAFLPREVSKEEISEKELDRILDKIRFEGMNALSESERATLDSQSRKLRGDL